MRLARKPAPKRMVERSPADRLLGGQLGEEEVKKLSGQVEEIFFILLVLMHVPRKATMILYMESRPV